MNVFVRNVRGALPNVASCVKLLFVHVFHKSYIYK